MKTLMIGLITGLLAWPAFGGEVPAQIDPQGRYLFYMHGLWLEDNPKTAKHRRYGVYQYDAIVQALTDRGYTVISEIRPSRTRSKDYAHQVMGQVNRLIQAGVPARNILVTGFSKGGQIALLAASVNTHPELRFVVMAGCGKGKFRGSFDKFLHRDAASMTGRMLSLYDHNDQETGTCQEAFDQALGLSGAEQVLSIGKGHGSFYTPDPAWMDKVFAWAE